MTQTGTVVRDIVCQSCGERFGLDLTKFPCPDCGGILDPQYNYDQIGVNRDDWADRSGSMWKYRELLPVQSQETIISLGEGDTPLIKCPTLADELGVAEVFIKDEGQNPTNTFKDRGQSPAISMANEQGIDTVALPSAGNAGQSASAYAARAGMDCHVFLNHQAGKVKKNLVDTHGAHLHLVGGKMRDAGEAFSEARDKHGWYSVKTFQTPYRHEGKKTMGYEIYEALDWSTPDEIIYPTGGGVGLIGIWKAYNELQELGWINDNPPRMTVAQSEGSAPVVEAIQNGAEEHDPWEEPDSIAKGVEIPDPGASPWILDVVEESGGAGVAVSDHAATEAAVGLAKKEGIEMCVTAGVALAGAMKRAKEGAYDGDDQLVITNCGAGVKTPEQLGEFAREFQ